MPEITLGDIWYLIEAAAIFFAWASGFRAGLHR